MDIKEIDNENKYNIRYKKTLIIALPLLILIMSLYYINRDFKVYYFLIEIFCATLSVSLAIIAILRNTTQRRDIYNYIAYGYLFMGLVNFFKIVFIQQIENFSFNEIFPRETFIVSFLLEFLIIIESIFFKKKSMPLIYTIIIYSITTILCIIPGKFLATNLKAYIIVAIIIFFTTFLLVVTNKKQLNKSYKVNLYLWMALNFINQIIHYFIFIGKDNLLFEGGLLRYICYYIMYEVLVEFILNIPYEDMKADMEEINAKEIQLNSILMNRNKELREIKAMIIKSERRYDNLLEAIRDGIIIFNFNRLSYVNASAKFFLNLGGERELLGRNFSYIIQKLVTKEEIKEKFNVDSDDMESIKLNVGELYKFDVRKFMDFDCEIYVLKIDEKNIIVYMKDVSEIETNHEIRKEYEEYMKEETVKNEFYANISHELRTPINLIYSALQLNDVYLSEGELENMSKNNHAIKQNCMRLIRTINNFIDSNKIIEGYIKPNLNSYNIVYIVENIALACNKYIKRNNSQLIFDALEEEIYCKCDKDMLERIMLNLLSNSVKYGKENGNIFVKVTSDEDYGIIIVKDDGYSISREMKPYIFDKFTKLNKSLSREKEGSGLGLFLCKELVRIQNGQIDVEYDENDMSHLVVKLPISSREERKEEKGDFVMNPIDDKVDIEFSDIYL